MRELLLSSMYWERKVRIFVLTLATYLSLC